MWRKVSVLNRISFPITKIYSYSWCKMFILNCTSKFFHCSRQVPYSGKILALCYFLMLLSLMFFFSFLVIVTYKHSLDFYSYINSLKKYYMYVKKKKKILIGLEKDVTFHSRYISSVQIHCTFHLLNRLKTITILRFYFHSLISFSIFFFYATQ
jgi:hypothetical protein